MTDFVLSDNRLTWPGHAARCAVGRGGIGGKRAEGDGITPLGTWPLRRLYYRPDRLAQPLTGLPTEALTPRHGWCDDPADPLYNQPVVLPFTPEP